MKAKCVFLDINNSLKDYFGIFMSKCTKNICSIQSRTTFCLNFDFCLFICHDTKGFVQYLYRTMYCIIRIKDFIFRSRLKEIEEMFSAYVYNSANFGQRISFNTYILILYKCMYACVVTFACTIFLPKNLYSVMTV